MTKSRIDMKSKVNMIKIINQTSTIEEAITTTIETIKRQERGKRLP